MTINLSTLNLGMPSLQAALESGTNIKTVNSTSLLGAGNVAVQPTLVSGTNIKTINNTSIVGSGDVAVQPTLVSGTNIKTINSTSIVGSGDVVVGYANIPQNIQAGPYTFVGLDAGKHILHPSYDTTARTYTIPANAAVPFQIGTAITIINQASAGVITIAITSDTMRWIGPGTTGSRTLAANGMATIIKVTAIEWVISGSGLS